MEKKSRVVTRSDIALLLAEAAKITNHLHFVIAGSLSIVGAVLNPPDEMSMSTDVDLYPKFDPGRAGEIAAKIGEGTDFAKQHGFYADAISPALLSLPSGWENRLMPMPSLSGVTGWFLDPIDTAVSKIIRGHDRDLKWIKSGISFGIFNVASIESRIGSVINVLDGEIEAARALIKNSLVAGGNLVSDPSEAGNAEPIKKSCPRP